MTHDPAAITAVFSTHPAAARLAALWPLGSKHRMTHHPSAFDQATADCMIAALHTAVRRFAEANLPNGQAWADSVCARLETQVLAIPTDPAVCPHHWGTAGVHGAFCVTTLTSQLPL